MDGRTWSLSEVPEFGNNMLSQCPIVRDQWMEPPAVVRQHASPRRSYVALSSQVRTWSANLYVHKLFTLKSSLCLLLSVFQISLVNCH